MFSHLETIVLSLANSGRVRNMDGLTLIRTGGTEYRPYPRAAGHPKQDFSAYCNGIRQLCPLIRENLFGDAKKDLP